MAKCESYPKGCPREPIVAQQACLMTERDRLYASVRETNDPREIASLMKKAGKIDQGIAALEADKNKYPPCRVCVYQD